MSIYTPKAGSWEWALREVWVVGTTPHPSACHNTTWGRVIWADIFVLLVR